MGKVYEAIDDRMAAFLRAQHLFFVGTAPAGNDGHVNLSPKGHDSFRVLDPLTVAYLDLTGSGIETVAHLRENGRVTLLFCAFEGPPRIVRLYGRGEVHPVGSSEFAALSPLFPTLAGTRGIIRVALTRVADSCGYAVPLYRYEGDREQLLDWAERKGDEGVRAYRREKNAESIDGLAGFASPTDRANPSR